MHSQGLELAKLTYSRHDDNLLRHRCDRLHGIPKLGCVSQHTREETKDNTQASFFSEHPIIANMDLWHTKRGALLWRTLVGKRG